MIALDTNMPGKRGILRKLQIHLEELGFHIDRESKQHAFFNGVLSSQAKEKLYLSLPFQLLQEEQDQPSAHIEFGNPKITQSTACQGSNLFQNLLHEEEFHYWKHKGEQAVQQIINHIDNNL
ncbi:YugN family protein [Oceanobacillus timonensis]|uniref:YugN family protein n=1 Tax=Oceanobacillus timonensis TaxID=1926285 RepID=UPI0015C4B8AE|nr:YugN family protein [Oceanobacillus timonensis]